MVMVISGLACKIWAGAAAVRLPIGLHMSGTRPDVRWQLLHSYTASQIAKQLLILICFFLSTAAYSSLSGCQG